MSKLKNILIFIALAFLATTCSAQLTSVSATITDSDSITWTNAQWRVQFVPNPNQPNVCNYFVNGTTSICSNTYSSYLNQSGTTNGSGALSLTVIDNTQISPIGSKWVFTIQSDTSAPATQYLPLTISGSSENLTTYLSINSIAPRIPATPTTYAYADVEISPIPTPGGYYFNVVSQVGRQWNGSAWQDFIGGNFCPLGGCTYTGPVYFKDSNGQAINYLPNGRVSVKAFGAKGDGVTDDTADIQDAVTYAAAHHLNVDFPTPSPCYLVTKSINAGWNADGADSTVDLQFYGEGGGSGSSARSVICHALTEAYPVIDMTGDQHCGLHNLTIMPLNNNPTNSIATAGLLIAAVSGANQGGGQQCTEDNTHITAGNSSTSAALVAYHVDQFSEVNNSWNEASVGAASVIGNGLGSATGVSSKFYTLCTSCNSFTYTSIDPTVQNTTDGGNQIPLQFTGSQSYKLEGYAAKGSGSTAGAAVSVSDSSGAHNALIIGQFRTEDQSSSGSLYCGVQFNVGSTMLEIHGATFNEGSATGSASICGTASAEIAKIDASFTNTGGGSAFNYLAAIDQGTIQVVSNSFGTIGSSSQTGVMHNLNIYEQEWNISSTDTANTILAGIYGNATNAFYNSGGKICGPNPIEGADYCITAQQVTVTGMNSTPASNSLSLPAGYNFQYWYNNGSGTVKCKITFGQSSSTTSLINFGIVNTDSGCIATTQLDLTTWTQVKFPGGSVLNSSDLLCYYDGSTYHNCPGSSITNHGIFPVSLSLTAIPANTVIFGPVVAAVGGTLGVVGNTGYGSITSFTCSANPVIQFYDSTTSTVLGSATLSTVGTFDFTPTGTFSSGDLLSWRFSSGICTALTLTGSVSY